MCDSNGKYKTMFSNRDENQIVSNFYHLLSFLIHTLNIFIASKDTKGDIHNLTSSILSKRFGLSGESYL